MIVDVLVPHRGKGKGVVLAHAWWGLNQASRDYGAALMREGFTVGLVDLFEGETATSIEDAEALSDTDWPVPPDEQLAAALRELAKSPAVEGKMVSAVGFSYSGYHLFGLAKRDDLPLDRIVVHYATRDVSRAKVPLLVHFAEIDAFESAEDMREVAARLVTAGPPNASFTYPGSKHWFAEPDRPEYDADAARLAFGRTVAFLRG